jgi:hypothetical protein
MVVGSTALLGSVFISDSGLGLAYNLTDSVFGKTDSNQEMRDLRGPDMDLAMYPSALTAPRKVHPILPIPSDIG